MSAGQIHSAEKATVWVVESGDYEQRGIVLIATSPEIAVEAIKARHNNGHFVVTWENATIDKFGGWNLTGHFERVAGWSTKHNAHFSISKWPVHNDEGGASTAGNP